MKHKKQVLDSSLELSLAFSPYLVRVNRLQWHRRSLFMKHHQSPFLLDVEQHFDDMTRGKVAAIEKPQASLFRLIPKSSSR